MIVTSEAHVESAQQKVCINEVGGLFCTCGVGPFGIGIGDHAVVSSFIRIWPVVGEKINLPKIDL